MKPIKFSKKFKYPTFLKQSWHENYLQDGIFPKLVVPWFCRIQVINPLIFEAQQLGGFFLDNSISFIFHKNFLKTKD